jgi:hypothetical protein
MLSRRIVRKPLILATILALVISLFPLFVAPAAAEPQIFCYVGGMGNTVAKQTGFVNTYNFYPVYIAFGISGNGLHRTVSFIEISSYSQFCGFGEESSVAAPYLNPGQLDIYATPNRWMMTAFYIEGVGLTVNARLKFSNDDAWMGLPNWTTGKLQNSSQITIFIADEEVQQPTVAQGTTATATIKGNACRNANCYAFLANYNGTLDVFPCASGSTVSSTFVKEAELACSIASDR